MWSAVYSVGRCRAIPARLHPSTNTISAQPPEMPRMWRCRATQTEGRSGGEQHQVVGDPGDGGDQGKQAQSGENIEGDHGRLPEVLRSCIIRMDASPRQLRFDTILMNCTDMGSNTVNIKPSGSRTGEVMRIIQHRIEQRVLTHGARLPSVRAMAQSTGISKSTVVQAYDRLVAEGTIRSRPGSGYYVAAPLAPLAIAEIGRPLDPQIDPLWMLRQSLSAAIGLRCCPLRLAARQLDGGRRYSQKLAPVGARSGGRRAGRI